MSNPSMGTGVGMGIHAKNIKKVYGWLWRSWKEAQHEVPLLRWLGWACVVTAGAAIYTALTEVGTTLEISTYVGLVILFALEIPVIYYLLFEVYRKHRTDAIYGSRRLADLIKKIALEQIAAQKLAEEAVPEKPFLVVRPSQVAQDRA